MIRTIGFASRDRAVANEFNLGGAAWYRTEIIARELAKHGWQVVTGLAVAAPKDGRWGVMPVEYIDASREEAASVSVIPDVMVLQRFMDEGVAEQCRKARAAGQVVINDVDDYFDALHTSHRGYRVLDPKRNPTSNVAIYRDVLRASSLLTVSTPFLADRLRVYGVPIVVLRNAIDLSRWCTHERTDPPRLGWTGSTAHRSGDLEQLPGVMRRVLGSVFQPEFVHVGAHPVAPKAHRALGVGPDQVQEVEQLPVELWPNAYRYFDVGVVPLNDVPFNRAKSYIKGVEMVAAGVPFVASASPEYRWLHATHGIGVLANGPKEWVRALRAIARNLDVVDEWRDELKALDVANRWAEWAMVYAAADP